MPPEPAPLPDVEATDARPRDPGADRVLEAIAGGLALWDAVPPVPPVVRVGPFRNQSHAGQEEVDRLTGRLAELLDRSGSRGPQQIRFTGDAAAAADFDLRGTAYLRTADGLDQWELYLSLRPADRGLGLWQGKVMVLRQPRRGQQIFP